MSVKKISVFLIIAVLFSGLSLFSCKKGEKHDPQSEVKKTVYKKKSSKKKKKEKKDEGTKIKFDINLIDPDSVKYETAKYIEEVKFSSFPGNSELKDSESLRVVGYEKARFWEGNPPIADKGNKGLALPLGSIVTIQKEYKGDPGPNQWDPNIYDFEGHSNYFYKAKWNGKTGYVFGADLKYASDKKDALLLSWRYTRPDRQEEWMDFNGETFFSKEMKQRLIDECIAMEKVRANDFNLYIPDYPDDMIALYSQELNDKAKSVFITTDLMVHSLHLVFDRMLTDAEKYKFAPKLIKLSESYLVKIKALKKDAPKENKNFLNGLELAEHYFMVGEALLKMGVGKPSKKAAKFGNDPEMIYPDPQSIISQYPQAVQKELNLIMEASKSKAKSPLFEYFENYTQYKPRGHYTKSEDLKAYFRAMMWYGRMQFILEPSAGKLGGSTGDYPDELILTKVLPAALTIIRLAKEDEDLYGMWGDLFDPITYIIGASDDLNFNHFFPVVKKQDWKKFQSDCDDTKKMAKYRKKMIKTMPRPKISGDRIWDAPTKEDFSPVVNFRLFGQRFTFDSFVFTQMTMPRISEYGYSFNDARAARGTDVMTVFGSKTARILAEKDDQKFSNLQPVIKGLQKIFNSGDKEAFPTTFYNRYLKIVASTARFEQNGNFIFTQKPAWNIKSLLTSHGSWAELRHDTLLYVKQSGAERAGGGPMVTFRTIDPKKPVHYVEPNLEFFQKLQTLLSEGGELLQEVDAIRPEYIEKMSSLLEISKELTDIVALEIEDKPISEEQNTFIAKTPALLAKIILPAEKSILGSHVDKKLLQMAIIADVHTDDDIGVLSVGTGIPYRMNVVLNDGQGGKRVAVGYIYSYYEFYEDKRYTTDEWKEIIYGSGAKSSQLPYWLRDVDYLVK